MSGLPLLLTRGVIYTTQFEPIRGHEQGGTRPGLVVSREEMTAGSTLVVVPITRTRPDPAIERDYVVAIPRRASGTPGLRSDSFALCHQLRAVTKERLSEHIGQLDDELLLMVDRALRYVLDLERGGF